MNGIRYDSVMFTKLDYGLDDKDAELDSEAE